MKIIADENVYEPLIAYLRDVGHDVFSIRDQGLQGISDDEVYQIACKQKRMILTMDKDFSRMFRFPPQKCGGILLVKIYRRTLEDTLTLFKRFYHQLKVDAFRGNLVTITPEGIRVRKIRS